ncbi:hypothetical protein D1BOALGB6SA_9417 [Olavius sp. associated proteobacterium Delta 1]|nr:hypothetical protein D1BOALGB6SA_9417 [Olavius sp. associated proteobacterium Delta 1]
MINLSNIHPIETGNLLQITKQCLRKMVITFYSCYIRRFSKILICIA